MSGVTIHPCRRSCPHARATDVTALLAGPRRTAALRRMAPMQAHELTGAQRTELQELLGRREQELQDAIAALRNVLARPDAGSGAAVLDSVEEGEARMMASVALGQLRRHEDELLDVRHARDRMHQGDYGNCEECGRPIPFQRLQARPEARFCLEHEEAWEKAHPAGFPVQS